MTTFDRTTVADAMTYRPVVVNPDDPLAHAVGIFAEHGFDMLPVCREGWLTGLLTRADVLRACGDEARAGAPDLARVLQRPIAEVMLTRFQTVTPRSSLADAVARYTDGTFYNLPVVIGGLLIGILTRGDVVRAIERGLPPSQLAFHAAAAAADASWQTPSAR